ncbi:hypothetical protein ACJIZ3_017228 [Penstemon smallii]|uniref:Fatty acyl-CoA reductase n=1 Tax=Penstemon smallii TaxID=265156 RepID=A0ABD3SUY0_9LAMI
MALTQSLFLCCPTKFSFKKSVKQTKLSYLPNNYENKKKPRIINMASYQSHLGYTNIPCRLLHHPLEAELMEESESSGADNGGIGIVDFFEGKNIFITGGTGLVGKVLVEKLLRSTSVAKIYILIKAKDEEAAFDRLTKEIMNSDLLKCLKEKHGKSYQGFLREKLIPIVGDICEPNLGMGSEFVGIIKKNVDIIIGSAASTTLNERYDVLLDANVNAPQRLMRFAKTCRNLKIFVHISTAYVNGLNEGIVFEKALVMGENRRKESCSSSYLRLDVSDEINLALKSSMATNDYDVRKELKRLGQERASLYGWHNAYHLTKAMAEMVLNEIRGDVPLLIIRPTVIESCYKDPFPGWIQGNRMFDPVIISYGKGQLPAFLGDPEGHMDIIPVDMVASTTIAAMAKHGMVHKPELNVYHVASSHVNPLKYSEFFDTVYEYFNANPLVDSESSSVAKIEYFDNFNDFSKYTREKLSHRNGMEHELVGLGDDKVTVKFQNRCKAKVAYAEQLCKMYEFIGFFRAKFHTGNSRKLIEEMSIEEQLNFDVDAMNIDWRKYFKEIHIPGLRKHVIN